MEKDLSRHPCFNKSVAGKCGRVHLPVAPKCNIQCNYCNRKYDCVNESRPGVTSAVLSPAQAMKYMQHVLQKEPRITVAGIAGPGDPFADAVKTLDTMRRLREMFPQLIFCLSSNGLGVPAHIDELADLGASHMTITVNAVDPHVGQRIYAWVRDGKVVYRGEDAARLLLSRQLESIYRLKEKNIIVKVNTILIPGINDKHVLQVSRKMADMGVDIMNIIPLKPTEDTVFEHITEPGKDMVDGLRREAGMNLKQMTHCQRCRADAVGLLCHDKSAELAPVLRSCSRACASEDPSRPYIAVATREGMLVNEHLGAARSLEIWQQTAKGSVELLEVRKTPLPGCGPKRWEDLAAILSDCRGLLVQAAGDTPKKSLGAHGIGVHECTGFIREAVELAFGDGDMSRLEPRKQGVGGGCCSGNGEGCG